MKPSDEQLKAEKAALSETDLLLAELVDQRGPAKLAYDDEDGWFLQFIYLKSLDDSWTTLDMDRERHTSPTAAIRGAVLAHNDEILHGNGKSWKTLISLP